MKGDTERLVATCRYCDGEGTVKIAEASTYNPDTAEPEAWDECPQCQGFGYVDAEDDNHTRPTKEEMKWAEADLAWEREREGW